VSVAHQAGKPNLQTAASRAAGDRIRTSEQAQSKRMLVALALLLVAIGVVAYRDRQFLFEAEPSQKQTTTRPAVPQTTTESTVIDETKSVTPSVTVSETTVQKTAVTNPPAAPVRAVPQQNQAQKFEAVPVKAARSSVTGKATAPATKHPNVNGSAAALTAQAAQRTRMAEITVQQPETALYPRLDQRTKVEGSVELQALVGTDGTIQELHVVRGPAVLGSAAREAVLQWKFKPFTQNGVAVETYARITVNFTIKVVDGSPKTVASVEPEHVIILADSFQR
jgi:TonB family protein